MKKIDKHTLRNIINETLGDILLEGIRDQMSFGNKGPIPVEPASSLCDDVNPDVLAMVDSGDKSIPRRMIGDTKYFGGTKVWDAYIKYSDAITRRADLGRTAVNFFVFLKKIRHGWKGAPLQVYESNENYLIGTMRGGVFLCIYICPKNVGLGMFKFVKEVCEYDNVVFAVTDDMVDMLERLGCPKYEEAIMAKFRGSLHEKMVYGSTIEAANKGAKLLNLMGKSGQLGDVFKGALEQNPKLKSLLDQNPNLPFEVINVPEVTKLLMNNPQIVDFINSNPDVLNQIAINPVQGLINGLIKYKNSMVSLSNSVNEITDKNIK